MSVKASVYIAMGLAIVVKLLFTLTALADREANASQINAFPDLTQSDKRAELDGGGEMFCGPVAVSNSLVWLSKRGYPKLCPQTGRATVDQVELVKVLAGSQFMKTAEHNGTFPGPLLRGLRDYIRAKGYKIKRIQYCGIQPTRVDGVDIRERFPDLTFMKSGRTGNACAWLHVQMCKYEPQIDQYHSMGAHWLTLVGYGVDQYGNADSGKLIVHDSAARAGGSFTNHYLELAPVRNGILVTQKFSRPANGSWSIASGLCLKRSANVALIDGCAVLELK